MLSVAFLDYEGAPLGNSGAIMSFFRSQYFLSTWLQKLKTNAYTSSYNWQSESQ